MLTLALSMVDLRPADEARRARRLRRLQRRPADAARPEAARRRRSATCSTLLTIVVADGRRAARCASSSTSTRGLRDAGGARERAARRIPRRLGAARDGDQLRARRVLRRPRRRAGRALARPHRAELQLLDDLGRVRLRRHPRRLAERRRGLRRQHRARGRALVLEPRTSRTPGSSRSACSCSS